ncbi:MAG: response regulator [Pirellulaceae bacterium]
MTNTAEPTPKHCLIADDIRSSRQLIFNWLQESGFRCTAVEDGEAAWQVFSAQEPDLVIADIEMPGHSGLELLKMIRCLEADRPCSVPVLMVTSLRDSQTAAIIKDLGGNGVLSKPLDKQVLYEAVVQVVSNQTSPCDFILKTSQDMVDSQCVISPTLRRLMRQVSMH